MDPAGAIESATITQARIAAGDDFKVDVVNGPFSLKVSARGASLDARPFVKSILEGTPPDKPQLRILTLTPGLRASRAPANRRPPIWSSPRHDAAAKPTWRPTRENWRRRGGSDRKRGERGSRPRTPARLSVSPISIRISKGATSICFSALAANRAPARRRSPTSTCATNRRFASSSALRRSAHRKGEPPLSMRRAFVSRR